MRKISFYAFLSITLIAFITMNTGCKNKNTENGVGIRMANLDTTVRAQDDFYQYACGGWMKNHPLTGEYSRFGSFDLLGENNRERLRTLIEEIAEKPTERGSVSQKIANLYNVAMDSTTLNKEGYTPIQADLDTIANLQSKEELKALLPYLTKNGVIPYFYLYVGVDINDSQSHLLQTYQGGIGMGQRDYYLDNDTSTQKVRKAYRQHIANMFELVGETTDNARKYADDVMEIETRLAKSAYSNVALRNPRANYNKMSIEELQKMVPQLSWEKLISANTDKKVTEISVGQKENLIEVGKIIEDTPLEKQKSYIQWQLITSAAPFLSDTINKENFDFFGKILSGKEEQSPRWKRAVSSVDGSLGEAVGQVYVKKYFPAEAKKRMLKLVGNLQASLSKSITNSTWMEDSTKQQALEKLNSFYVKIGYPDKWRDYSALDIESKGYWANMKRVNQFENDYMFAKLEEPVDKDEWHMNPQTVNAYYNPTTNEICFPAGILQYPFFDMEADDAFNYGAIGVVIGHEMTHGFDDQGRQYDKTGNLRDWWTANDAKNFDLQATLLSDYFDQIEVAPGTKANGKFTLGENLADYGGLKIAYRAFIEATEGLSQENKNGFTPAQRFFLAYAAVWANNIRPEEILKRTKTDPHSLGRWRVNGTLPHINAWYEAFDVKPTDKLYLTEDQRVNIW